MADTWWIVREGTLGQIVSSLDPGQIANLSVQYHAVQNATKPNSSALGPYPTKAAAQTAADAQNAGQAGLNSAAKAAVPKSVTGAFTTVGQFLGNLANANLWIRVGQVVLGLALITVGLAKLTEGTSVGNTAAKAAKVAMLA